MAYGSIQADSAGMKQRQEMAKPGNPFEDRLRQSASAGPAQGPAQHPGLNPASFRSNPFARMGGMGARAAMAERQSAPQPPPQAPAYGIRSRGGAMRPSMDFQRGGERFRGVSLTPPPTGMPGGIMGERNPMDRYREFGRGGGFDPLRERLMGTREDPRNAQGPTPGAASNPFFERMYAQNPEITARTREAASRMPPPQTHANPFFARMYEQGPPPMPIQQENYPMFEQMYY